MIGAAKILELDAGNTRIKWRLRVAADVQASGVVSSPGKLEEVLAARPAPDRVLVVSVRGAAFDRALSAQLIGQGFPKPEFARVTRRASAVSTRCTDLARMGVDRWLAVLAAWHRNPGAGAVIDCGTAVTVDVWNADAEHQGGYIVPGLNMQLDALLDRTAIRFKAPPEWGALQPGLVTETAVCNGIYAMLTAWLIADDSLRAVADEGRLYLTGGDAQILVGQLRAAGLEPVVVNDLVMDGLTYVETGVPGEERE